jgi:hypothetical protein
MIEAGQLALPAKQRVEHRAPIGRQLEPFGGVAVDEATNDHCRDRRPGDAGLGPWGAAGDAEQQDALRRGEIGGDDIRGVLHFGDGSTGSSTRHSTPTPQNSNITGKQEVRWRNAGTGLLFVTKRDGAPLPSIGAAVFLNRRSQVRVLSGPPASSMA